MAGQVGDDERRGAPRGLRCDAAPVRALAEEVAAVGVDAVGEVREVGRTPAAEAHRVDLDRRDVAGRVDAQLGVDGEVGEAGAPADLREELLGRRAQAGDRLGVREVDAVADVVGRREQVRVHVDQHRLAVRVVVSVHGELLALDHLLDDEVVQVQHLLRVQVAQPPDFPLDLLHDRRPRPRGLDHVDAQAEEAHGRLDDERRAQSRRVERAQSVRRHSRVAVVRVQVGDEIAERHLVLEQRDPPRQVRPREVTRDPADGVL